MLSSVATISYDLTSSQRLFFPDVINVTPTDSASYFKTAIIQMQIAHSGSTFSLYPPTTIQLRFAQQMNESKSVEKGMDEKYCSLFVFVSKISRGAALAQQIFHCLCVVCVSDSWIPIEILKGCGSEI